MKHVIRVAVFTAYSYAYGRNILRGIYRYANRIDIAVPWQIVPGGITDELIAYTREHGIRGVIGHIVNHRAAETLRQLNIPIVNTSATRLDIDFPRVGVDDIEIGRMAAEFFYNRGYRNVSSISTEHGFAGLRETGFKHAALEYGMQYQQSRLIKHWLYELPAALNASLSSFYHSIPKPMGVFVTSDEFARKTCEYLTSIGISVPDQVAIIGADDDELYVNMNRPLLTSVQVPGERVGYTAARLLDRLMHGNAPPTEPILLQPTRIISRQSTDTIPVDDSDLANVVRFIRTHALEQITIEDILAAVPISRRVLERRFRATFACSPYEMIIRTRVEKAKALLLETDLPIPEVARQSGFVTSRSLETAMQRALATTPSAFRRRYTC